MTLSEHIKTLQKLESVGHGNKKVLIYDPEEDKISSIFYCYPSKFEGVTDSLHLKIDEEYVSISIG